jgi:dTDP-glucose 4,6-dehydratase
MNPELDKKKTAASPHRKVLVTGGSGFIGSNFIRYLLTEADFEGIVVNLDKLTYAGNPHNLTDIAETFGGNRYFFHHGDICDRSAVETLFQKYTIDTVVHFAAESHVDRSILGPGEFIRTNIEGTFTLLEVARQHMGDGRAIHFHHVSTDEVFGSLGPSGYFHEHTPYDPHSPYSASKASSDHLVRAYFHTYGLPVTVSNCSNNYGPYQFPEKLIPLMILNAREGKKLPVYGDGKNVRDWLYVWDHCVAIWLVVKRGKIGDTYNIGGKNEYTNIEIVQRICAILEDKLPADRNPNLSRMDRTSNYIDLITFVKDRPGHDLRYAIKADKMNEELNWRPAVDFPLGLEKTVNWYLDNPEWIQSIRSGDYSEWIHENYVKR